LADPASAAVQASVAHPAHVEHLAPLGHCESLVHQHGTPAALQVPDDDDTLLQLPAEHDHAFGTLVAVWQSSLSADPLPLHWPATHWLSLLTHLPLEQLLSATQRHAVFAEFRTGAGASDVMHELPPLAPHGTELGAGMQPWPSSAPVPVQFGSAQPVFELGIQRPLGQPRSLLQ
jgi:hypothetical protein